VLPARLQSLEIGNFNENPPKVSSRNGGNSRFGETFGGDNFDPHCLVGVAVDLRLFDPISGGHARQILKEILDFTCLLLEHEQTFAIKT
jgi:hypothetical protein